MKQSFGRPSARVLMAAVIGAVVVGVPLAWANHTFVDVPTSSPHHTDVALMKATNITAGCNPPANTLYCPDQFVRRDQMASFLARALGLVVRPTESTLAPVTGSQADLLDGLDSSAFGVRMLKGSGAFSDLCTAGAVWNQCSTIQVTVPAGKTYRALVIARASLYESSVENRVLTCASATLLPATGANCFGEETGLVLHANNMQKVEHTTWFNLTEGTWVLSTAINPSDTLNFKVGFDVAIAKTTALIFDGSVPAPAAAVAVAAAKGR